jgi:hypothetical protein
MAIVEKNGLMFTSGLSTEGPGQNLSADYCNGFTFEDPPIFRVSVGPLEPNGQMRHSVYITRHDPTVLVGLNRVDPRVTDLAGGELDGILFTSSPDYPEQYIAVDIPLGQPRSLPWRMIVGAQVSYQAHTASIVDHGNRLEFLLRNFRQSFTHSLTLPKVLSPCLLRAANHEKDPLAPEVDLAFIVKVTYSKR